MRFSLPQYGGKYVVNPSGGLEAKGHPLGATGLGMHFYITSGFSIFSHITYADPIVVISATS